MCGVLKMVVIRGLALLLAVLLLSACKPEDPSEGSDSQNRGELTTSHTISQAEFNSLSADDQYVVANKALSTMYRGLPLDEFFDVQQGLESPQIQYQNFISDTQAKLQSKLTFDERVSWDQLILGKDLIDLHGSSQ